MSKIIDQSIYFHYLARYLRRYSIQTTLYVLSYTIYSIRINTGFELKKALEWLKSYTCNRKQYSVIDDIESDLVTISHGVLQGSILGPFLFFFQIYTFCRFQYTNCIVFKVRQYKSRYNKQQTNSSQ